MPTGLRIKEFGPFDAVALEFGPGLNVVSGDEAAVRVLLVDALGAALGGSVAAHVVRPRASASVEARFALTAESPAEQLPMGDQRVAVGPAGADRVTFLLGGASGEASKPIEEAVSGGDLSRVMLVIRHVLAGTGGAQVMVSADIDEGLGTRTARALGQVLDTVGRTRQLICMTRLPQVACLAGRHVLVEKETAGGRSRMSKDRVGEIARMLSGRMPATVAREYAAELLGRAQRTSGAAIIPGEARGGGA